MVSGKIKKITSFVMGAAVAFSTVLTPSLAAVYNVGKTARWSSPTSIDINLSCDFDAEQSISNGKVLFLGSRCSAHGMKDYTIPNSINAMAKYAEVTWYAYGYYDGYDDSGVVAKGTTFPTATLSLASNNHSVSTKFVNSLYDELVTKGNQYNLIVMEFDGDRITVGESMSSIEVDKLNKLKKKLDSYYSENKVIWVVPSGSKYPFVAPTNTNTATAAYKFSKYVLNGAGYVNPNQKDYNNAGALANYLGQYVLGFYGQTKFEDTVASGLTITDVIPQFKDKNGKWKDVPAAPGVKESTYNEFIYATITREDPKVTVVFNTALPELAAEDRGEFWEHTLRVLIKCSADSTFTDLENENTKATNESASIKFDEAQDESTKEITLELTTPKIGGPSLTISGVEMTNDVYDYGEEVGYTGNPVAYFDEDSPEEVEGFTYKYVGVTPTEYDSEEAPTLPGRYKLVVGIKNNNPYKGKLELPFVINSIELSMKPKDISTTVGKNIKLGLDVEGLLKSDKDILNNYEPEFSIRDMSGNITSLRTVLTNAGNYMICWENSNEVSSALGEASEYYDVCPILKSNLTVKEIVKTSYPVSGSSKHTINFETNGGNDVKRISVAKNTAVSDVPVPSKSGYYFAGWYKEPEFTNKFSDDEIVTKNMKLYAKWVSEKEVADNNMNITDIVPANGILAMTIGEKDANVWGVVKTNDVAPIIKDGNTMLPAKFVAENLGGMVSWNEAERKVTIKKDNSLIHLVLGSDVATVNGKEVKLNTAAFADNGRTYVPVRFISEQLGYRVLWNDDTKGVMILK